MAALSQSDEQVEIAELREIVREYRPGENVSVPDKITFPDNLFIGLFGKTGSGKSSLINSLKFAVAGRLRRAQWVEVATQEKAGGHTMFRKIANLTQCIYVVDNRGLENPNAEQAQAEIAAQLDGHRGYSEQVQWSSEGDQGADAPSVNLNTGHPISCAVFVFSAIHDIKGDFAGLNHVVDFLHLHQGCYPIAVVTHVDVAQRKDIDILSAVLRVSGIGDIYEVANITNEKTKLEEQYQLNLLNFIERCMTIGDDTAVYKHYQQVEMKEKAERKEAERKEAERKEAERRKEAEKKEAERKEAKRVKMNHTETVAIQEKEPRPEVLKVDPEIHMQEMEEGQRALDRLKHDLDMRKMQLDFQEKGLKMKMDFEKQQFELQRERQNRQLRQQEQEEARERRLQEELSKILQEEKRELLMRMMEANRSKSTIIQPKINVPGCPIQ